MAQYGNSIFRSEICSSRESRSRISDTQILNVAKELIVNCQDFSQLCLKNFRDLLALRLGATSTAERTSVVRRFDRKHLEHVKVLGKECRRAIQAYQNRYHRPLCAGIATTELDSALNHDYYLAYITYRAVNQVINQKSSSTFSSFSSDTSSNSLSGPSNHPLPTTEYQPESTGPQRIFRRLELIYPSYAGTFSQSQPSETVVSPVAMEPPREKPKQRRPRKSIEKPIFTKKAIYPVPESGEEDSGNPTPATSRSIDSSTASLRSLDNSFPEAVKSVQRLNVPSKKSSSVNKMSNNSIAPTTTQTETIFREPGLFTTPIELPERIESRVSLSPLVSRDSATPCNFDSIFKEKLSFLHNNPYLKAKLKHLDELLNNSNADPESSLIFWSKLLRNSAYRCFDLGEIPKVFLTPGCNPGAIAEELERVVVEVNRRQDKKHLSELDSRAQLRREIVLSSRPISPEGDSPEFASAQSSIPVVPDTSTTALSTPPVSPLSAPPASPPMESNACANNLRHTLCSGLHSSNFPSSKHPIDTLAAKGSQAVAKPSGLLAHMKPTSNDDPANLTNDRHILSAKIISRPSVIQSTSDISHISSVPTVGQDITYHSDHSHCDHHSRPSSLVRLHHSSTVTRRPEKVFEMSEESSNDNDSKRSLKRKQKARSPVPSSSKGASDHLSDLSDDYLIRRSYSDTSEVVHSNADDQEIVSLPSIRPDLQLDNRTVITPVASTDSEEVSYELDSTVQPVSAKSFSEETNASSDAPVVNIIVNPSVSVEVEVAVESETEMANNVKMEESTQKYIAGLFEEESVSPVVRAKPPKPVQYSSSSESADEVNKVNGAKKSKKPKKSSARKLVNNKIKNELESSSDDSNSDNDDQKSKRNQSKKQSKQKRMKQSEETSNSDDSSKTAKKVQRTERKERTSKTAKTEEEKAREELARRDEELARQLAHEDWVENRPGRRQKAAEASSKLHDIFTGRRLLDVDAAVEMQRLALMSANVDQEKEQLRRFQPSTSQNFPRVASSSPEPPLKKAKGSSKRRTSENIDRPGSNRGLLARANSSSEREPKKRAAAKNKRRSNQQSPIRPGGKQVKLRDDISSSPERPPKSPVKPSKQPMVSLSAKKSSKCGKQSKKGRESSSETRKRVRVVDTTSDSDDSEPMIVRRYAKKVPLQPKPDSDSDDTSPSRKNLKNDTGGDDDEEEDKPKKPYKRKTVFRELSKKIKKRGFHMNTPYEACPRFLWFFKPHIKKGDKITINELCKLFLDYIGQRNLRMERNKKCYVRFTKRMCRLFDYEYVEGEEISHNMGNVGKHLVRMHIDFQNLNDDGDTPVTSDDEDEERRIRRRERRREREAEEEAEKVEKESKKKRHKRRKNDDDDQDEKRKKRRKKRKRNDDEEPNEKSSRRRKRNGEKKLKTESDVSD